MRPKLWIEISVNGVEQVVGDDLQAAGPLAAKLTPLIYAFDRAILSVTKNKRSMKAVGKMHLTPLAGAKIEG